MDSQLKGESPYASLKKVLKNRNKCKVAVAGGINEDNLRDICQLGPDVVIIGGAINKAQDSLAVTKRLKAIIDDYNNGEGNDSK